MKKRSLAVKKYGVRRFTEYRGDGRCFEMFELATGECASFPGTKKRLEEQAKAWNTEQEQEGLTHA